MRFWALFFVVGFSMNCMGQVRKSHDDSVNLFLPRDEGRQADSLSGYPKASQMVLFLVGNAGVYAYKGGNIKTIRPYTYADIRKLLKLEKETPRFSVLIKPSASSTYKNIVNMLDEMAIAGIKHYDFVEVTKDEEGLLSNMPYQEK